MLSQLRIEDIKQYPTFADKVIVVRTQMQCGACHCYIKGTEGYCPSCGVQFL